MSPTPLRPTWAEVDLGAVAHNFKAITRRVRAPARVMAVVKADGYGHGAVAVAKRLARAGAAAFGVSTLEEGVTLREAGIRPPILVLGNVFPFSNLPVLARHRLTPTVCSLAAVREMESWCRRTRVQLPLHIKVDTGMARIGISPRAAPDLAAAAAGSRSLRLEGVYTHFAGADSDGPFTERQWAVFQRTLRALAARGLQPPLRHAANSAALLKFPESHLDMVRPGLALYGLEPYPGLDRSLGLRPAMRFMTRIVFLKRVPKGTRVSYNGTFTARRPTWLATLPVGYADGYPRALSNRGEVLVNGRRAPVVGAVCMDMCLVDVSGIRGVRVGTEATLFGPALPAEEVARRAGTIVYEIVTSVSRRVPRMYVG